MAYKFQLGDFVASGSILTEGHGTTTSDMISRAKLHVSGAATLAGAVQANNTITDGVDDTGYDVKFFGATSGKSMLWDESADSLIITGDAADALKVAGGLDIDGVINVGEDDTGYDVKFFGDTASAYMLWDTSADDLILAGGAGLVVPAGQFTLGSTAVAATAAELNIMDGDTSVGTTAVSDGHGIVMNHGGTMAQTTVQTLAAYLDDEITAMPNLASAVGLTTIGAAGATTNIAAGDVTMYNAVDNGNPSVKVGATSAESLSIQAVYDSGAQTLDYVEFSTAAASGTGDKGKMVFDVDGTDILTIDDGGLELKNSAVIGTVADADLLTLGNAVLTVAGEVSMTTLDIGGTNVSATAAELNHVAGVTSAIQTQLDAKSPVAGHSSIVTVGTLDTGAISANFGNIDNGTSNITTGGLLSLDVDMSAAPSTSQKVAGQAGSITFGAATATAGIGVHSDNLYIENVVDTKSIIFRVHDGTDFDNIISINGMGLEMGDDKAFLLGSDEDISLKYNASAGSFEMAANANATALNIDWNADGASPDNIDKWRWSVADGGAMTLSNYAPGNYGSAFLTFTPHSTLLSSVAAFGGDVRIAGDLIVSGSHTVVSTTNMAVEDQLIELNNGQSGSPSGDIGFVFERGSDTNQVFIWDESADKFTLGSANATGASTGDLTVTAGTLVVGTLEANSLQAPIAEQSMVKAADYTWDPDDGKIILVSAASDDVDITLPNANAGSGAYAGLSVKVKRTDTHASHVVKIQKGSVGYIDGNQDSVLLETPGAAVTLYCDGSNWHIF